MKLRAYFMLRTLKNWKKTDNSQQTSIKPFHATGSFTILLFFWCFQKVYKKRPMAWTGFNPFVPNALFLYFLKTSENLMVFLCFQGVEKVCIGNEWVTLFFTCCCHTIIPSWVFPHSLPFSLSMLQIIVRPYMMDLI